MDNGSDSYTRVRNSIMRHKQKTFEIQCRKVLIPKKIKANIRSYMLMWIGLGARRPTFERNVPLTARVAPKSFQTVLFLHL